MSGIMAQMVEGATRQELWRRGPGLHARAVNKYGTVGTPESLANRMNSEADSLKLKCEACGHQAEFMRAAAWKMFGMGATPHSIRRRAKCILCGERNLVAIWI
jgi:hypothetical protein